MTPKLRFSPIAWQKIIIGMEYSKNEIGFWGITDKNDGLWVCDVYVPEQEVSSATTDFKDGACLKYLTTYAKQGYAPYQLGRVWIHTHPGNSTEPSGKDRHTFKTLIGQSAIGCMVIFGQNHTAQAWLLLTNPEQLQGQFELKIPVEIDWHCSYAGFNYESYIKTLEDAIEEKKFVQLGWQGGATGGQFNGRHLVVNTDKADKKGDDKAEDIIVLEDKKKDETAKESKDICLLCGGRIYATKSRDERTCLKCGTPLQRCSLCYNANRFCAACDSETEYYKSLGYNVY